MADGVSVTNNTIGAVGAESQHYGIYVSNQATNVTALPNTFGAVAPGGAPLFFQPQPELVSCFDKSPHFLFASEPIGTEPHRRRFSRKQIGE